MKKYIIIWAPFKRFQILDFNGQTGLFFPPMSLRHLQFFSRWVWCSWRSFGFSYSHRNLFILAICKSPISHVFRDHQTMPKSLKYINVVFASLPCSAPQLHTKMLRIFPPMSRFLNNTFITIQATVQSFSTSSPWLVLVICIPIFMGQIRMASVASSHKTFSLIHRERSSISMGNMHSWGGRKNGHWTIWEFPKNYMLPTQVKN